MPFYLNISFGRKKKEDDDQKCEKIVNNFTYENCDMNKPYPIVINASKQQQKNIEAGDLEAITKINQAPEEELIEFIKTELPNIDIPFVKYIIQLQKDFVAGKEK